MDTDNTGITMRLTKRMRSLLRPPPLRSGAAPRRRAGGAADDAGFTPAEIIIGVILVGILATGVTIKAVQMMEQARDSAAQSTLRTAAQAAGGVYGIVLKGGVGNFAALLVDGTALVDSTGTKATTDYDEQVTEDAINQLRKQEPNVTFKNRQKSGAVGNLKDYAPDGAVWVEVNADKLNPSATSVTLGDAAKNPNKHDNRLGGSGDITDKTTIRAGELIRLGIVSAGGSSFCLVRVGDSYEGTVSGDGWQAVNEKHTLAGAGADCGAEVTGDAQYHEMPKTVGTDPTLSSPTDNLHATLATAAKYLAP